MDTTSPRPPPGSPGQRPKSAARAGLAPSTQKEGTPAVAQSRLADTHGNAGAPAVPAAAAAADPNAKTLPKDFQEIRVAGDPPPVVKPKKTPIKRGVDAKLTCAKLRLFCFDRSTGAPIGNVELRINTLENVNEGLDKNFAKAFGNTAYSRNDGVCILKLVAGHHYVITASCSGYQKFGEMGEFLRIVPKGNERIEKGVGMVPIRISVTVTLRELCPLAGQGIMMDPTGQVNPAYTIPQVDKTSVQPQKVSFVTPGGVVQTFLATTHMAHAVLKVAGDEPQPAASGALHLDAAQADQQHQAAANTASSTDQQGGDQAGAGGQQPGSSSLQGTVGEVVPQQATEALQAGDETIWTYSTDSEGHCFFYGPRIDAGRSSQYKEYQYLDVGPWQYSAKFHLERNMFSPPDTTFGDPPPWAPQGDFQDEAPDYGNSDTMMGYSDKPGATLRPAWLKINPEIAAMLQPPPSPPHTPRQKGGTTPAAGTSPRKTTTDDTSANLGTADVQNVQGVQGTTAGGAGALNLADQQAARKQALMSSMGCMPLDPEGVHNYLFPGAYGMSVTDTSKSLIFYTYASDTEMSEVTSAQQELVQVSVPDADPSYMAPPVDGSAPKRTNFPVQLYLRAKPWFKIQVFDADTGEEVGAAHSMRFTIKRFDHTRSMAYRIARLRQLLEDAHSTALDPAGLPPEQMDAPALEYLKEQERHGKLTGFWAQAEIQADDRTGPSVASATGASSGLVEDLDALYAPYHEGCLPVAPADDDDSYTDGHVVEKTWIEPGNKYCVMLHADPPYVPFACRQTRMLGWELEPFVFYATRQVTLSVGLRERFSHAPIRGMKVKLVVNAFPRLSRPPIVSPEWCESPELYARRLLDMLIDHVVQDHAPSLTERIITQLEAVSDDQGLVSFVVPPDAHVSLECEVGEIFEKTNSQLDKHLSREPQQSIGIQLERIVETTLRMEDCVTGDGLEGCVVKAYYVTHLVTNPPRPGGGSASPTRANRMKILDDEAASKDLGKTHVGGLTPFWCGTTNAEGQLDTPIRCRAGLVIKLVVAQVPHSHLLPEYLKPTSGAVLISTYDFHHVTFKAPPKPRIKARASDMCTLEWVHGVRLRIFARRYQPVFVPEGEDATPSALTIKEQDVQAGSAGHTAAGTAHEQPTLSGGVRGVGSGGAGSAGPDVGQAVGAPEQGTAGTASQAATNKPVNITEGTPFQMTASKASSASPSLGGRGGGRSQGRGAGRSGAAAGPASRASSAGLPPMVSQQIKSADSINSELLEAQEEAEEEAARSAEPDPFLMEPFGDLWYDTFTGHPHIIPAGPGMMMDAGLEVQVQLLPVWPYVSKTLERVVKFDSWQSPPPVEFMLPRDDMAFRFWMERDRVLHTFYTEDGEPRLPYHPLARLQPMTPPAFLLAPYHPALKPLKTANVKSNPLFRGRTGNGSSPSAAASGNHTAGSGGVQGSGGLGQGSPGGGGGGSYGHAGGGQGKHAGQGAGGSGGGSGSDDDDGDGGREQGDGQPLYSCPSAIQFTDDDEGIDEVREAAWAHMRLAESRYLPLEKGRLMGLLAKWGAFPHVEGGSCRACFGPVPSGNRPFFMRETHGSGSDSEGATSKVSTLSSAAEREARTGYRSKMMADDQYDLAAAWAIRPKTAAQSQLPPHMRTHNSDKYARTHAIMARAEAIYCKTPFFTWRLGNGSSMHVGVHELLYRDLISLLDRVAASVEFMDRHLTVVRDHNASRGKHGRFLFGHEAADGCGGGVFVVDASRAQPFGGVDFMLDQIGKLWDFWAECCPPALQATGPAVSDHATTTIHPTPDASGAAAGTEGAGQVVAPARRQPPLIGLMMVASGKVQVMRPGLGPLCRRAGTNTGAITGWWSKVKAELPEHEVGVKLPEVLSAAFKLSAGKVPCYLLMGGLVTRVRGSQKKVSHVLYEAQLQCIDRESPLQPMHTVELFPMPQLKSRAKGLAGAKSKKGKGKGSDVSGSDGDAGPPSVVGGGSAGGSGAGGGSSEAVPADPSCDRLSLSSTVEGADVFEMLQTALSTSRVRLVDVFRELDQDGTNALNGQQLMRLLQRFVPDATPAHRRYFQLLLDVDGNSQVTYKELCTMFKAANKGAMAITLREELEVNMLLQRLGLVCVMKSLSPREVFDRYDVNSDGFLDQVEQWRMLKDLFPGLLVHEQQELFAAVQEIDINSDERISWSEFSKAFSSGGVQALQAWGDARDPDEVKRMKEDSGGAGPDEVTLMQMRADQEAKELREVQRAGYPLTKMLAQLSGSTRGRHRRLDLGHARAAAEPIDMEPLERSKAKLDRALEQLKEFEAAYGAALVQLVAGRSASRPASPAPGGGGGALVTLPPPSSTAMALLSKARAAAESRASRGSANDAARVSGAAIGRAKVAAERQQQATAYALGGTDALGQPNASPQKKKKKKTKRRPQSALPGTVVPLSATAALLAASLPAPLPAVPAQPPQLLRQSYQPVSGISPWDDVPPGGLEAWSRQGETTHSIPVQATPGRRWHPRPSSAPPARDSAMHGKPPAPVPSIRPRQTLALGAGQITFTESPRSSQVLQPPGADRLSGGTGEVPRRQGPAGFRLHTGSNDSRGPAWH